MKFPGVLLIAAAVFKAHELFFDPSNLANSWTSRFLQFALVELEIVLGLWLLSGFRIHQASNVAMLSFSIFAGINVYKIYLGEQSCGCFGKFHVDPAIVLAVDLFALVLLVLSRNSLKAPNEQCQFAENLLQSRERLVNWQLLALSSGLLFLAISIVGRIWMQPSYDVFRLVTAEPGVFDFGQVQQGQSLTQNLQLSNNWSKSIEVVKAQTSCGCTTVDGIVGRVVMPGEVFDFPVTLRTGDTVPGYERTNGSKNNANSDRGPVP